MSTYTRQQLQQAIEHYSLLSKDEIETCKAAFSIPFQVNDERDITRRPEFEITPKEESFAAEYIGYLIYRALKMKRKYLNKKKGIIDYLNVYRTAEHSFAAWIRLFGTDSDKNPLAHRMMAHFLTVEDL